MCWLALRGSPRASRASQGPRPSAVALSSPLVGRSAADMQRWRLQSCSRAWRGVFEGDVEFKNAAGAPARHGRRGRRRLGRGRRRRRRRPTWDGGTRAARRARRAADVDAGAHRSSRRREVVPETPSRAAACCARSASAVSSLLEIICGVGSRLPACTRIVLRRACLCEVRWGNGLRCGARAVVRRCCGRICWRRSMRVYHRVPSRSEYT